MQLFMSSKYAQERDALCGQVLSSYLKKRMSYDQLCKALELCLKNPSPEWALLLRFSLTWMASCARRSVDVRTLAFTGMVLDDLPRATASTPWVRLHPFARCCVHAYIAQWLVLVQVGVGPSTSRALAFVVGQGKSLPAGMCEASAAVR